MNLLADGQPTCHWTDTQAGFWDGGGERMKKKKERKKRKCYANITDAFPKAECNVLRNWWKAIGAGTCITTTETLYAVRKWLLCPLLPCVPSIHSHKSFGKANVLVRSVTSLQEPEDLFWWLVKIKSEWIHLWNGIKQWLATFVLWAVVAITGTQQGAIVV